MNKILVTGASGNVGKYVVKELLRSKNYFVTSTSSKSQLQNDSTSQIKNVILDFCDNSTFDNALNGIDRVFLIRPPHLGKPEDLYPFIDSMKKHNIKLVVFLSLMGVEKNPIPPHHKIEKYIEKVGLPFAHIRPGFFMQNLSGIHSVEIKENNEIFVPAGKCKTSFIDAADIGLASAILLSNSKKYQNTAHTITGKVALDYYEIAEILSNVVGRKITYTRPSYLRYRSHYIKKRGLDKKYVNVTVALYFMSRLGTAKLVTDDFYKLTGKLPRSFEQFAIDNITAFM